MAEKSTQSIIVRRKEILIADASRYFVKADPEKPNKKNVGQEVVCLNYMEWGKPAFLVILVSEFQKLFSFASGSGKETLSTIIGQKIVITETISAS